MRFLFSVEKYTFKSRDSTYKGIFFVSLPFIQDNVNGVQIVFTHHQTSHCLNQDGVWLFLLFFYAMDGIFFG